MKTSVTFEFTEYADRPEFKAHIDGPQWKNAVWEMDQYLRNRVKYEEKLDIAAVAALEAARQFLRDDLASAGLSLDD